MFGQLVKDLIIVAVVIAILRYFVGATSLLQTGGQVGVNLFNAASGLNQSGQTAGYAHY